MKEIPTRPSGRGFSKSPISRLSEELDEQTTAWSERLLEGPNYPLPKEPVLALFYICMALFGMTLFGQPICFNRLLDIVSVSAGFKNVLLFGAALLLVGAASPALSQEVETYSGEGTAILGTGMTMEQTQRLALEAARRQALQKFGSYVRSEETLRRFSGEDANRETFVQETEVISASVIRLKKGTKEVTRQTEGKTIRFVVRAEFEIDKNTFNKRVKQYQNAPEESRVRQLVDRGVRIESKIQDAEGTEELQRLTGKRLKLRKQIRRSLQRLDGSQALTDIGDQRDRRRKALKRHLRFVKDNLHPYSIAKVVPQGEPRITDQGEYVQVKANYKVRLKEDPQWALAVGDTLRTLTRSWYSEEGWNPIDPQLLRIRLWTAFVGTSVSGRIVFLEQGPVISTSYWSWPFGDRPSDGISEDGEYYLNDAREKAVTVSMYNSIDVPTSRDGSVIEYEVNLPLSAVERLESINFVFSHLVSGTSLSGFVESKGFERVAPNEELPMRTFVNASDADLTVEDITPVKDGFGKYLDLVAKAAEDGKSLKEVLQQRGTKSVFK